MASRRYSLWRMRVERDSSFKASSFSRLRRNTTEVRRGFMSKCVASDRCPHHLTMSDNLKKTTYEAEPTGMIHCNPVKSSVSARSPEPNPKVNPSPPYSAK